MDLNKSIIAYEIAHYKYMDWLSDSSSQRRDWVTAYETIVELLDFNSIPCDVATGVCGREYRIIVYIENERFDFTFEY